MVTSSDEPADAPAKEGPESTVQSESSLVPESSGTSGIQESGTPIEPEIIPDKSSGLWGDDLVAVFEQQNQGSRALARSLLSFVITEVRRKNKTIDSLSAQLAASTEALTIERIAHGNTKAKLSSASITPALALGPIVAALGIAVFQGQLRLYGAALVAIGILWIASGVWNWWSR
jgi:hypothetical protein